MDSVGQILFRSYEERIRSGQISEDLAQRRVLTELAKICDPSDPSDSSFLQAVWRRLAHFLRLETSVQSGPRSSGLYIYGPVGSGKTMLMDLFFSAVQKKGKKRLHFHEFMLQVHESLHNLRACADVEDPVLRLSSVLSEEFTVLCLDEMQIVDIADAMLVGRLFSALLAAGVTIVTTSNQPPEALYADGVNRERFLPFIQVMRSCLQVICLDSGQDYRLQGEEGKTSGAGCYFYGSDPATKERLEALWKKETAGLPDGNPLLHIRGKELRARFVSGEKIFLEFSQVCAQPRASSEYLWLAKRFHTVFLQAVPRFTPAHRSQTRRFIHLMDILYDAHVCVFLSAEVAVEDLCADGEHEKIFVRTVSRLREINSLSYRDSCPEAWRSRKNEGV